MGTSRLGRSEVQCEYSWQLAHRRQSTALQLPPHIMSPRACCRHAARRWRLLSGWGWTCARMTARQRLR